MAVFRQCAEFAIHSCPLPPSKTCRRLRPENFDVLRRATQSPQFPRAWLFPNRNSRADARAGMGHGKPVVSACLAAFYTALRILLGSIGWPARSARLRLGSRPKETHRFPMCSESTYSDSYGNEWSFLSQAVFKCLLIAFVIWNMSSFFPPNTGCNLSSAKISRLFSGF
jgi:hypothetical protein